jgi:hypothetical protein
MIRVNLLRELQDRRDGRPYFSIYQTEATLTLTKHARRLVLRVYGQPWAASYGREHGRYRPMMRWRLGR